MVSQSFRVSGVYKTDNLVFDQMNAFVRKDELARLTGLSSTDCHEIGILLYDEEQVKPTQAAIKKAFPALSVMNWLEISPDAGMLTKYMDLYYYILMGLYPVCVGIRHHQHHAHGHTGTHQRTGYAHGHRHEPQTHLLHDHAGKPFS